MQMNKRYIHITIMFLCALTIVAQQYRTEKSVEFSVGSAKLSPAYSNNAAHITDIIRYLRSIQADSSLAIANVTFSGSASLEGSYEVNRSLADSRRSALESIVRQNVDIPDSVVKHDNDYIHWNALSQWVADSETPCRDEVLQIISQHGEVINYDPAHSIDSRILDLKRICNGNAWRYICDNYFPTMRSAAGVFITVEDRRPAAASIEATAAEPETVVAPVAVETAPAIATNTPTDTTADVEVEELSADTLSTGTAQPAAVATAVTNYPDDYSDDLPVDDGRSVHNAIKTNLLYDAILIPNIGLDIHLGNNWSFDINWMYAWWKCDHRHYYWRTYGGDAAIRKWFGSKANEKPLQGHHIGIYGQMFTYDFELGGRGYLCPLYSYAAGLEYGYSLPIGKHLNLDFNIGVGYLTGKYKEYLPEDDCYVWQCTKNRRWIGPTKLEIALVWLVGHNNFNKRKPK
jgi:hypothetical protein